MDADQIVWTTQSLSLEAAKLGKPVSREYLRRLCQWGSLRAEKPGRDWLISDWQAQAWLKAWIAKV